MGLTRRWRQGCRDEAGMSLVELIVVVTVIGIVAMVGLPSMQEWIDRYEVRTAATEIASAIQLQRMRAVSRNREFSILFDEKTGRYTLYDGQPSDGTQVEARPRQLPRSTGFATTVTDPVSAPGDAIVCHPDGSLNDRSEGTDTIYVGNSHGHLFEVSVNRATGRVQVINKS